MVECKYSAIFIWADFFKGLKTVGPDTTKFLFMRGVELMEVVSLSKCTSYEYTEVEEAVFKCLDDIGGIKDRIPRGSRVLIKANLLKKNKPEDAVTTHPAVVEAIARYLQKLDCKVIIADSPAGPFTRKSLEGIYKISGMEKAAQGAGCELNYDISVLEVVNDRAKMLKGMQIIKAIEDADFVISAAKLKTHGMMTFTGAVKNLFGVIPGLIKAEYHFKLNDESRFAQHLVDICEYVKPVFSVIDGIEGMEGNGPSGGEKRHVGLILASSDPYALDTVASSIIGIEPLRVPTIKAAAERGIFSGRISDVKIKGLALEKIKIPPFKLPESVNINFSGSRVPAFVSRFFSTTLKAKPVFDYDACISCGDCKRICPPQVISMKEGKPVPDLSKCIACFCCHEVCPKKAVEIKKHWLSKFLYR